MPKINEAGLIVTLYLLLVFAVFNFDFTLAGSFNTLGVLWAFIYLFQKFGNGVLIEIEKTPDKFRSLYISLIAYFALIIALGLASKSQAGMGFSLDSVFSIGLNSLSGILFSSTPTASGNVVLQFIIYGVLIPIFETVTIFIRGFSFYLQTFKVPLSFGNLKGLSVKVFGFLLFLILIFGILHLTAKAQAGSLLIFEQGIISVLIFGAITGAIIIIEGQGLAAIFLHIIANSVTLIIALHLLQPILAIIVSSAAVYMLFSLMEKYNIGVTS